MNTNVTKHVGVMDNTNKKIIVVFNQIPNREDHALVVDVDALPDRINDAIENLLKSSEGQKSTNFGEVLGRRVMPDTNEIILNHLHNQNRLQAVPVEQVVMLPRPNNPVPLTKVLEAMGKSLNPNQQKQEQDSLNEQVQKLNQHSLNQQIDTDDGKKQRAQDLRVQADILESDVNRMRNEANMLDPKPLKAPVEDSIKGDVTTALVETTEDTHANSDDEQQVSAQA